MHLIKSILLLGLFFNPSLSWTQTQIISHDTNYPQWYDYEAFGGTPAIYPKFKIVWGVDGSTVDATAANPFPITCISGCSGSGGGTVNQGTQGSSASPWFVVDQSVLAELEVINTILGSPFQAGGTIGNTAFGATQSGVWTVTAVQPTASLFNGTVVTTSGATIAKDSSLSTINSTLGSPMQTTGGIVTANQGTPGPLASPWPVTLVDGQKNTYIASYEDLVPGTLATDIAILNGSATKIVRVINVTISGTRTTSGSIPMALVKRSTPDSGGTCIHMVTMANDGLDPAATAVAQGCSSNPTLGVLVGYPKIWDLTLNPGTTTDNVALYSFNFGALPGEQSIVLRGVNDGLSIYMWGFTVAGAAFNVSYSWTEE